MIRKPKCLQRQVLDNTNDIEDLETNVEELEDKVEELEDKVEELGKYTHNVVLYNTYYREYLKFSFRDDHKDPYTTYEELYEAISDKYTNIVSIGRIEPNAEDVYTIFSFTPTKVESQYPYRFTITLGYNKENEVLDDEVINPMVHFVGLKDQIL